MTQTRRTLIGAAGATSRPPPCRGCARLSARARAQGAAPGIKIGVLNDLSGPYRDTGGRARSPACARPSRTSATAFPVEVVSADHQNKPDVGASASRGSGSTATAWT